MDKGTFDSECVFTKVVTNSNGQPAILIAGEIIDVKSEEPRIALWIASALRTSGQDKRENGYGGV